MKKVWNNSGVCAESELSGIIGAYDYEYYVAYQIDRFRSGSGNVETLDNIEWVKLLEIRLFSEKSEFLARRTMTGAANKFQWRIASEEGLREDEYIVRYQALDIDSNYTKEGEHGNLQLMTTGGGKYELPIEKNMESIRVVSYIAYSAEDGMAAVYDNRLAGFVKEGEY